MSIIRKGPLPEGGRWALGKKVLIPDGCERVLIGVPFAAARSKRS
jgi:hypothetical protein